MVQRGQPSPGPQPRSTVGTVVNSSHLLRNILCVLRGDLRDVSRASQHPPQVGPDCEALSVSIVGSVGL